MTRPILTQEHLKECVEYNQETGIFVWKIRPLSHFKKQQEKEFKRWNSRYFGECGHLSDEGYLRVRIDHGMYLLHRLAFLYVNGDIPQYVDHINHDRTDNRWSNLRAASKQENCKNRKMNSNNSTGTNGVYRKPGGRWMASIGGQYLGSYQRIEQAIHARNSYVLEAGYHENHGKTLEMSNEQT